MGELRELDLKLAFRALCPLRENIQNQAYSIDDTAVERPLQVALLSPGQGRSSGRRSRRPCRCRRKAPDPALPGGR
jgi:hypothetical protein